MEDLHERIKLLSRFYPTNTQRIFRDMMDYFNLEELKTLCFELDVDYDSLGGEGKKEKLRELILLMKRQKRLDELMMYVIAARPKTQLRPFFKGAGTVFAKYDFPFKNTLFNKRK